MAGHTELTGIALVGLAALMCGMIMTRFRQPPVVGYILAGLFLGPSAAGLVANEQQIHLLAELGVLMLLFMIGLELPVAAFMKVWRIAVLVTLGQIAGFLLIAFALADLMDWPPAFALLIAFAAALSSTAVAIKMIEEIGEGGTETGRIAVAVLIAQDLAVVPMMLIIGDLGGSGFSTAGVVKVVASGIVLTLLVVYFSRKGRIRLPFAERVAAHPELRPVAAIALCLAAAAMAGVAGLSAAYGAFIAGLVLGNAHGARDLTAAAKPIEGLLMMVFFLSVGLLIDLRFIADNLARVLWWLAIVTVAKTALNIALFRLLAQPWPRAFLAGVLLGQVGEFSFLLAAVGARAGIVPEGQTPLVVSVVALSLLISPLWLAAARRLGAVAAKRRTTFRSLMRYLYGAETGWLLAIARLPGRWARAAGTVLPRRPARRPARPRERAPRGGGAATETKARAKDDA